MKKAWIILTAALLVIPAIGEPTNEVRRTHGEQDRHERKKGEPGERRYKDRREFTPEQKAEFQERRLQLMEKSLKEIGVTEEQQQQIRTLQQQHKEKMRANSEKVTDARRKLSELEKTGASEAEIYAAIDAISEAQSEQMKILVSNRMQMERILGKEKYKQFMETARNQYRKHGRHGGSGMPPRPGLPPIPGEKDGSNPPTPPKSPPTP
jgi:Spy/CpxP family protein refolding chaperone